MPSKRLPRKADGTIDKRYLRGITRKNSVRKSRSKSSKSSRKVVRHYFIKKTGKYLKRVHPLKGRHRITGNGVDLRTGAMDIFYDE
jgi:hypothetical protein